MATLEVHDARGRVEFVTISQDSTALIGSDPKCDVVLPGPEILPIHGRLRWKRGRLKVEATPEAYSVEVNGHKVVSSKLHQGDEIRVGTFRIFLLNAGDGAADVEKTRVQERPAAVAAPAPLLERADWLKEIEVAPPSIESEPPEPPAGRPVFRRGREPASSAPARTSAATTQPSRPPTTRLKRFVRIVAGTDRAPGEERVASSPVVLGLVGTIALLAVLSVVLWGRIARRAADNQYLRAMETFRDGDDLNAIKQLDQFIEKNPEDPRVGKARVTRALARVRQFTGGAAPAWSEGLEAARGMIEEVGQEPAFEDASADLAESLLKIAEGLAERASKSADSQILADAEAALALHKQLAGPAAEALESRSRVPARLASAREAVQKGQARLAALKAMDAALKAGSAAGIYEARDRLVARYRDLAADPAVVQRLTLGNDLLRGGVRFDPSTRPALIEPVLERLGPPTSFVLRGVYQPLGDRKGTPAFALAEGFAYGLSEADGAPLWHVPVGLSSPFAPVFIGGERPSVLVVDARHDDLLRLDARDGRPLWRQPLGEPVHDPPLVLGNDLFQVLPSGKLLRIDLDSGELRGTLDCQRPLAGSVVADELGQHLYLPADQANLFILTREPLACVAVEYLGHEAGSIPCAPARVGRYLVVPVNDGLHDGHWRVLLIEQDGAKVRPIQELPVMGWTWSTPASQGSTIWSTGDRGGMTAYAIGAETERVPFQKVAQRAPADRPTGPAFARARNERELWLSAAQTGRFDLSPERGTISPGWTVVGAGAALAPIQYTGRLAILTTQQSGEGRGVSVRAIDPVDGSTAWETILGLPWYGELAATDDGLTTIGVDGQPLAVSLSQLRDGGFIEQPLPAPGAFRLPGGPLAHWRIGEARVVLPDPHAGSLLVGKGAGPLRAVALPSPLAAAPVAWGGGILLPCDDGLLYLVDPAVGAPLSDPYVPPFDRARPTRWLEPAIVSETELVLADRAGRVRKVARQGQPRDRLVAVGDPVDLGAPPASAPIALGQAVIIVTGDGKIRSLSTRDLSPLGAANLPDPLAYGPVIQGDRVIVGDVAGHVLAFGPDGQLSWSAEPGGAAPAGPPGRTGETLWFLDRQGAAVGLSLADGTKVGQWRFDTLPAGGPVGVAGALAVPVAPGSVQLGALDATHTTPAGDAP
jgi:outer membrane protein assembly factor BamB